MIECKNVSYTFTGETSKILENVTVQINDGKITMLLGVNGSGKTTLLNCIGGNIDNYQGEIMRPEDCQFIHQLPVITEKLTGMEYIDMLMSLRNMGEQEDITNFITSLGLTKVLSYPINEAAEYTKMLLLLLTSLCLPSNTVLLDDPFRVIDQNSRKVLGKIINKLKKEGKTVVVATNVIYTGFELADELVILHQGVITQLKNKFKSIKDYDRKVMRILMND